MNFYRQRQDTVKMSRVSVISNITVCPVKTVPCAVLQLEVMCDVNSVWNLGLWFEELRCSAFTRLIIMTCTGNVKCRNWLSGVWFSPDPTLAANHSSPIRACPHVHTASGVVGTPCPLPGLLPQPGGWGHRQSAGAAAVTASASDPAATDGHEVTAREFVTGVGEGGGIERERETVVCDSVCVCVAKAWWRVNNSEERKEKLYSGHVSSERVLFSQTWIW